MSIWNAMLDRRDIVDIRGLASPPGVGAGDDAKGPARPFLGVWFRCCHVYGRMTKSEDGTRYTGVCPKCGAAVKALVGEGGTSRRIFEAG